MKKTILKYVLALILICVNINSMMKDAYSEHLYIKDTIMPIEYDLIITKETTVKNLLKKLSMNDVVEMINDSMLIDKINVSEYKKHLSFYETGGVSNSYTIVNKYGYAGKYQFGKSTLRTLRDFKLIEFDIDKEGKKVFLADSALQERTLNALLVYNLNYANDKDLLRYVGKKLNGVIVTTEGILAGSHLVGISAVRHYLENKGSLSDFYIQGTKCSKYDGNGVSVVDYMKIFENV